MAELLETELRTGEFMIQFETDYLFEPRDVANLLSTLNADYGRRFGRRKLYLSSIRSGSLIVTVIDAMREVAPVIKDIATLAKDGNSILTFGKSIRDLFFQKKSQDKPAPERKNPLLLGFAKKPPEDSVAAIASLAVKSKSNVYLRQEDANGNKIEFSIEHSDIVRINDILTKERRRARADASRNEKLVIASFRDEEAKRKAEEGSDTTSETALLIKLISESLSPVERIKAFTLVQTQLANNGHADLARLVSEITNARDL